MSCHQQRPRGLLLVGVMSWPRNDSASRRSQIRRLWCSAGPGRADLRFVLPAGPTGGGDEHSDVDDVLRLPTRGTHQKLTGKLFLSNAFLRYATSCEAPRSYSFVARMDDDALVNASAIADLLPMLLHERYALLGSLRHWYSWEPATYYAVCWSTNANRAMRSRSSFSKAVRARWGTGGGGGASLTSPLGRKPSQQAIARWAATQANPANMSEWRRAAAALKPIDNARASLVAAGERMLHRDKCLRSEGPFPFVAGPFMVFSHALAKELMALPTVVADDARDVEGAYGRDFGDFGDGSASKRYRLRHILLEDVYYGWAIAKHFGSVRVSYVRLAMVEWATGFWHKMEWATRNAAASVDRRQPPRTATSGPASYDIFHKLKLAKHFKAFDAVPLLAPRRYRGGLRCGPIGELMQRASACCAEWQICFPGRVAGEAAAPAEPTADDQRAEAASP